MDNRFRREKNLSRSTGKKSENMIKNSEKVSTKAEYGESVSFGTYFLESYKKAKKNHIFRDTILLSLVLLFVLFTLSHILPKVFSFHLDTASIVNLFNSHDTLIPSEDDQDTGNLDILILGRGGKGNSAPDLTDSIILAHYNKSKNSLITVSIPRDLLIKSEKLGQVKINELYSSTKKSLGEEAAMNYLMEIVSQITGKNIRMYALIDFTGFQKLVDTLGGVDIEVPEHLYDSEYPTANWGYTIVNIPAGLQHFDGDKALKYSRSRHTTSDFDRSRRQQLVIQALREKMTSLEILTSPTKLRGIYEILSDSTQTNISLKDMYKLAKIGSGVEKKDIYSYALDTSCFNALRLCEPGGLIYSPGRELYGGMSVLLPKKVSTIAADTYETIRLFVGIITENPTIQSEPGLTVLNASGKTNLALTVALKLRSIGIPIDASGVKNQSEKIEKTFIRYNPSIVMPDSVFLRAILLAFSGDIREATSEEMLTMSGPYELVLGRDSSLYFQY